MVPIPCELVLGQGETLPFPNILNVVDDGVVDDSIDPKERPTDPTLDLPPTLDDVPLAPSASEQAELSSWVRWLVLRNLPKSFEDNRKWGKRKEVYNGFKFRREGWRIETERKWKDVQHGTWSRYYIEFVDPANRLEIAIRRFETSPNGTMHIETQIVTPLKLFGRVSQWQRNVQLVSISADADAIVEMNVACDIQIRINPLKFPPDVEFVPHVHDATILLREFKVHDISQIHGPLAELLGRGIRQVLDDRLENYRDKLVEKMNSEIAKQQGKLKLSFQDWLQTSLKKQLETR